MTLRCIALVDAGYVINDGGRRCLPKARSGVTVLAAELVAAFEGIVAERVPEGVLEEIRWYDGWPGGEQTRAHKLLAAEAKVRLVEVRQAGRRERNTLLHLYRDAIAIAQSKSADVLFVVTPDPDAILLFLDVAELGVRALSVTIAKGIAKLGAAADDLVVIPVATLRSVLQAEVSLDAPPRSVDVVNPGIGIAFVPPTTEAAPRRRPAPGATMTRPARVAPSRPADEGPPLPDGSYAIAEDTGRAWAREWLSQANPRDVRSVLEGLPMLPRWIDAPLLARLDAAVGADNDVDPRLRRAGRKAFVGVLRILDESPVDDPKF